MKSVSIFATFLAAASAGVSPSPATAQATSCEVHVWQSKVYISGSPAPYGALLQAFHDSKYPSTSVEGQMEYELRSDAMPGLIGALWTKQLGQPVNVVAESAVIDKEQLKALKVSGARNSSSTAPCYFELYVGKQTFEGGFIKSHLFSEFTLRTFAPSANSTGAIVWAETKHFPAKDAASVPEASDAIRNAFMKNVGKFLAKKLGSPQA